MMDERMELEIARTVGRLRQSMPRREKKLKRLDVFRVAALSISKAYLVGVFLAVLLFDLALIGEVHEESLLVFYTSPLPMLLMFHKYILSVNEVQRELESTFRYSYSHVMGAKVVISSVYMLLYLALLAFVTSTVSDGHFLRLALFGAVPSLFLSSAVMLLSGIFKDFNGTCEVTFCMWILSVAGVINTRARDAMLSLSDGGCAVLFMLGLAVFAAGTAVFMKRRVKGEYIC